MDIFINGSQLDFSLENEKTVGDILQAVEEDCAKNNATIISIRIDDTLINEDRFNSALLTPLDTVKKIELETIQECDVVAMLQNVSNDLEKTIEDLQSIPVLLQSSKDKDVSSIVLTFVDQFNSLQRIRYFCTLFPQKFQSFTIEGLSFTDFLTEFMPILQEFESSLETRDTVLTGDLAEYEIAPKLQKFVDAIKLLNEGVC